MVMLLAAMGFGVVIAYLQLTPDARRVSENLRRHEQPSVVKPEPKRRDGEIDEKPNRPARVTHRQAAPESGLMVPVMEGDTVKLEPCAQTPPAGVDPKVFVADAALRAIHADGARALSVQMKDRVAILAFNDELEQGFGSMQEASLLKALQLGMGQFDDVDKVLLTVDGRPAELGHFDASEALDVLRSPDDGTNDSAATAKPGEASP